MLLRPKPITPFQIVCEFILNPKVYFKHIAKDVYFYVPGETACCHLYMFVKDGLKSMFQGLFVSSKWLKEGNCYHKTVLSKVNREVNESFLFRKIFGDIHNYL